VIYLLALLIGVVAGLRAMTAPAAIAWAAYLGWLDLSGSWLAFLGSVWAVGILTILALAELVTDQLPSTPSRTVPPQPAARLVMGALIGAAIGIPYGAWIGCLIAGVIGATIGTYGGAAVRARLAASFGKDSPAAFIEDAIAIIGAYLIVSALPTMTAVT
jgi:Predicted membrane protein